MSFQRGSLVTFSVTRFKCLLDVPVDLDGIVYKRKDSPYKVTEKLSCYLIKIKNSRYSQCNGVKNSLNAFEAS